MLSTLIAEITLRLTHSLKYGHNYYLWPPFLSRQITVEPGVLPGISGTKNFYVNSIGIRGNEPGENYDYKIVAIGGSTTESGDVDDGEMWTNLLQQKLSVATSDKIWVANAGRRGSTLRDNILHLKYFVSKMGNTDAIILLSGINDFMFSISNEYKPFNQNTIYNPTINQLDHAFFIHPYTKSGIKGTATYALLKQAKITVFGRKIINDNEGESQMFWRQKRQNAVKFIDILTLSEYEQGLEEYERNLNIVIDMSKQISKRTILMTQPTLWRDKMPKDEEDLLWFGCIDDNGWSCYTPNALQSGIEMYNQKVLEVCKYRNVECIDLTSALPKSTEVFADDVHFNEEGSRKVSQVIFEYMITNPPISTMN